MAHTRCNAAKGDHVAAEDHLAAWVQRNERGRAELAQRFAEASLPSDPNPATQIAKWVYRQTALVDGQVWVAERRLTPITPAWLRCSAA